MLHLLFKTLQCSPNMIFALGEKLIISHSNWTHVKSDKFEYMQRMSLIDIHI